MRRGFPGADGEGAFTEVISAVRKHVRGSVTFTKDPFRFPSCDSLDPQVVCRNVFSS